MYGYKEELTKELILRYVTQEEIFQMVIGYLPKPYVYVTSPFRKDTSPGCYFEWYNGVLYFKDWSTTKKHKDCFNAVQKRLGIGFLKALQLIAEHFELDAAISRDEVKQQPKKIKKTKIRADKNITEITFAVRDFNNTKDKDFWSRYGITKRDLIADNVFPITWYRLFSKRLQKFLVIRPVTRTYLIYNQKDRVKIYTPDITGRGKWITNCTENDVGNLDKLRTYGNTLLITKSYKDFKVLQKQGIDAIWFQNEGMYPDKDILKSLVERFSNIIIFFDNDTTGIRASEELRDMLNEMSPLIARSIWLPSQEKDPSDLVYKQGEDVLREFLIREQVINEKPF